MINGTCCLTLRLEDDREGKKESYSVLGQSKSSLLQTGSTPPVSIVQLIEISKLGPHIGSSAFKQGAQVTKML